MIGERPAADLPVKVATIPSWALRAAALVPGQLREISETLYQFEAPFVMDSSRAQALLGLSPTPLQEGALETVAWWRKELSSGAA